MATSKATPKAAPTTPRLKERYRKEIVPALMKEFSYSNVMQAPVVHKIVINIGMGEALQTPKAMENAVRDLSDITGQRPVVTKAKRSVASFKLREGNPIGCTVTLRGNHMYDFLDKLVSVALPRLRDFQGVSRDSFDGRGNYTLGIREQLVFPEINYDKIDKVRGMEITIVTTAHTDEEGRRLLQLVGMPFKHQQTQQA
ncbi:MAG TPA: 50S ribosomal protein L5 [Ktedonobacterales bacterium]|jgi:large subunit ribosomal protein L5|nr:50S ribosomal protein L5 [Ktedonobacterales bacterium]